MDPSLLDRYFKAVDSGDVAGAVACFSQDAIYVKPEVRYDDTAETDGQGLEKPIQLKSDLLVLRGRAAIAAYLQARGLRPLDHSLTVTGTGNMVVFAEGRVPSGPSPELIFFSEARFDEDGLITRYVTLSTNLPRAADGTIDDF